MENTGALVCRGIERLSTPDRGLSRTLDPESDFPEQPDPAFTRARFSLKHSQGGGGFKPTAERTPFVNSLFSALPAISGSTAQAPLWQSLAPVVGGWSVYNKDSKPEGQLTTEICRLCGGLPG